MQSDAPHSILSFVLPSVGPCAAPLPFRAHVCATVNQTYAVHQPYTLPKGLAVTVCV